MTLCGRAQTGLQDSPFLPPPTSAAPIQVVANETLQLSGISVLGKKTFVSLYDTEKKKSRWVQVGETIEGVQVISCDPEAEQAVVKTGEQVKVLALKKPVIVPGSPAPAFTPAVMAPVSNLSITSNSPPSAVPQPTGPLTPTQIQEREARMLVSDLLEIGIAQRKAYEEKQKQAAAEAAAKKRN